MRQRFKEMCEAISNLNRIWLVASVRAKQCMDSDQPNFLLLYYTVKLLIILSYISISLFSRFSLGVVRGL